MISHQRLLELIHYDPDTGVMTNRIRRGRKSLIGKSIGWRAADGYCYAMIDGETYALHRLIWFYVTGEFIPYVDHKDRVRDNNRWYNLRSATKSQNSANSPGKGAKSGFKGVNYRASRASLKKYQARIRVNGKLIFLGWFATGEEAARAYDAAACEHFGAFAWTNF